jgi:hypothetical protein
MLGTYRFVDADAHVILAPTTWVVAIRLTTVAVRRASMTAVNEP